MKQMLCLAVALIAVASSSAGCADQVDRFAESFILRHNIPSAAVAVVKDGRLVKSAGYGLADLELQVPARDAMLYEIGSITKQFTAEAVMMLAEDGRLSLDDPIRKYLKDIPPAWSSITIRHLLAYTSGLRDWEAAGDFSYRREYTPAEFVALLEQYPLDFAACDRWSYTNSGHPLLGMIIEAASGQGYEQFVSERIFKRAGMADTRFKHPEEIVRNRSGGYVDRRLLCPRPLDSWTSGASPFPPSPYIQPDLRIIQAKSDHRGRKAGLGGCGHPASRTRRRAAFSGGFPGSRPSLLSASPKYEDIFL